MLLPWLMGVREGWKRMAEFLFWWDTNIRLQGFKAHGMLSRQNDFSINTLEFVVSSLIFNWKGREKVKSLNWTSPSSLNTYIEIKSYFLPMSAPTFSNFKSVAKAGELQMASWDIRHHHSVAPHTLIIFLPFATTLKHLNISKTGVSLSRRYIPWK